MTKERDEASVRETVWEPWVAEVCQNLDVDADAVDIPTILRLTKDVAHNFERPMAPVGAYMLGLAVSAGKGSPQQLADVVRDAIPSSTTEKEDS